MWWARTTATLLGVSFGTYRRRRRDVVIGCCGYVPRFVCLLVGYISVKKTIENCNFVGAGAHKGGKIASFWSNFDPNFTDIWGA